jgi:type IV pilus assembly protein PilM
VARLGEGTKKGGGAKAAPRPKPVVRARPSGGAFVGLDIGTQTIKMVEVSGAGSGLRVTGLAIENTPPGTVMQGVIADPKTLGAALKQMRTKNGIKATKCVCSVAGAAGMVVRVIEVPKMTPSELAETMKWEVERHIPFAASDVELSFQKIDNPETDNDPNNPNMEVLLAVAQRDMIAQHINTLTAAGLTPLVIDVEPLAVGRALIDLSKEGLQSKNVVIVNMGASQTDVGVFKGGALRYPRTIPLGGDNLTRAIADRLGLSMDAAEDEKRAHAVILMDLVKSGQADEMMYGTAGGMEDAGISTPFDVDMSAPLPPPLFGGGETPAAAPASPFDIADDNPFANSTATNPFAEPANPFASPFEEAAPDIADAPVVVEPAMVPVEQVEPHYERRKEVFNAILPMLGEFVMELRRSVDYFRSKYPNDTMDLILLCGGSARVQNLDQYIEYDLGVPTSVADPFAGLNVVSKNMSVTRRMEIASAMTVALGLAARDAVLGKE